MPLKIIAQFLENGGGVNPDTAKSILDRAYERLKFSILIIGWNLPEKLISVCKNFCERNNLKLYRWQPLLTSDGEMIPNSEWACRNLFSEPIRGFKGLPEFTFCCPNREEAAESILGRVRSVMETGDYDGMFLDRIRFPSPMENPSEYLGCFCKSCRKKALNYGLDLGEAIEELKKLISHQNGAQKLLRYLFNKSGKHEFASTDVFDTFFNFRESSITDLIKTTSNAITDMGFDVGLDCFSPLLARAAGQNIKALSPFSKWIKIMSYGHTLGVAGIPFELIGLVKWLSKQYNLTERDAVKMLSYETDFDLPDTLDELAEKGIKPKDLAKEVRTVKLELKTPVVAGMELVDLPDFARLNPEQIKEDFIAFRDAGASGIAMSWDLRYIPLEYLDILRENQSTIVLRKRAAATSNGVIS